MRDFCQIYNCQNIIKDKTCFKKPHNPSCVLDYNEHTEKLSKFYGDRNRFVWFPQNVINSYKIFYKKKRPKIARCRNYCNFDNKHFINEGKNSIEQEYCQNHSLEFGSFKKKVDSIVQKHASLKKRYVKANQAPFIDKNIDKHIMKTGRLRYKFLNTKSNIDRTTNITQRNLYVSLIRQAKKQFFSNLNTNVVTENKTFWRTVKSVSSDKVKTKSKRTLIEKKYEDTSIEPSEEIISDEEEVAEIFNNFFVNTVPNLKIPNNHNCNI